MIFEHFAINVNDPIAAKEWYCEHLDLQVVSEMNEAPFTVFLADSIGRVVCEFYNQTQAPIMDYTTQHVLTFHFAFVSENAEGDKARLVKAGASFDSETILEDGTHLVMLRDPWNIPLQLCQRTKTIHKN